jgi:hypothetical protein
LAWNKKPSNNDKSVRELRKPGKTIQDDDTSVQELEQRHERFLEVEN